MQAEQVELPPDFDGQVRLFPLPNLVVFPRNVQPLHIFESRYREMLEDALVGDRLIAMATLKPGFEGEYHSRPPISEVVCIGHVAAHDKNENGTYDVVLVGLRRAIVEREISPLRAFRRAAVRVLEEKHADAAKSEARRIGRRLAERLVRKIPATEKLVGEFLNGKISLGVLTDILAFHLPFDLEIKLALLTETEAIQRAALLLTKLPRQPNAKSKTKSFPPDFGSN